MSLMVQYEIVEVLAAFFVAHEANGDRPRGPPFLNFGAGLRHDAARGVVVRMNRVAEGVGRGDAAAGCVVGEGGREAGGVGRGEESTGRIVGVDRRIAAAVGRGDALREGVVGEAVRHGGEVYHFHGESGKGDTARGVGPPMALGSK